MRRTLLTIALFLLLGAIANIGVAWSLALLIPFAAPQATAPPELWSTLIRFPDDWPRHTETVATNRGFGWRIASALAYHQWASANAGGEGPTLCWTNQYGLPFNSMRNIGGAIYGLGFTRRDDGPLPPQWLAVKGPHSPRAIPLHPIPAGFLLDTLFYAAVLYTLTLIPFHLRRALRKRNHLCPRCAYPIGQSPICTECGAALTPLPLGERAG